MTPVRISLLVNLHPRDDLGNLKKCLLSARNFADEVIIINMLGSRDLPSLPANLNIKVYAHRPLNYVEPARNFAISKATGKWIFFLDPDEYITHTLKKEFLKITRRSDVDYVRIPRKNFIFGRWIRHSRWWPDYIIRFFKKGQLKWQKDIHSQPQVSDRGLTLMDAEQFAIRHRHYENISQYLERSLRYAKIQANELLRTGYHLKVSDLIRKPADEFLSRFFAAEGYKDGIHGLVLAILQAFSSALVYLFVWEKEGQKEKPLPKDTFVSAFQKALWDFRFWFFTYLKKEFSRNPLKKQLIRFRIFILRFSKL